MKKILQSVTLSIMCAAPLIGQAQVNAGVVKEQIPTYKLGAPETDPIFFTGRVYQGAEGYIYPYQLYDRLTDEQEMNEYDIVKLDNEWINIGILPEIGGRIFQAKDRTNNYNFFYTQTGVKPALIGMLGAWLSGGVEWNIPDHHRASSYLPVNWTLVENNDGSKTAWVGESELRHRLKWSVGVTVHPNRSWVEANVKVVNPTPMIQSMLYWANVSVHCGDDYQVIFPPDVEVGVDHHKVYFTNWPEGPSVPHGSRTIDQSWWKNFTEGSRSIFAWDSKMEFLAGYDYAKDAGTVHVANRHQVPGKKFFLWGNTPHGQMWNKILSDRDGHYLELMVGAYSDNQPDYSWINPGEIREFSQIWFPIKGIKGVKNATVEGAVNFEPTATGKYLVGYNVTTNRDDARIVVKHGNDILLDKKANLDPEHFFLDSLTVDSTIEPWELYTALYDNQGNLLVDYTPVRPSDNKELPNVIDGTKPVKDYDTVEELYLAGLRVDQFNNARLQYMDFYNEALERDSLDARVNIEVAKHYIRQGELDKAEKHLLRAQKRLAHDYTRVMNTEGHYYLGYLYTLANRPVEAEENLWAATYTPAFKHPAYYQLALAQARNGNLNKAIELIDESLLTGAHDLQALTAKANFLRRAGHTDEAMNTVKTIKSIDPLDRMSEFESAMLTSSPMPFSSNEGRNGRNRGLIAVQEMLEAANNYITFGDRQGAEAVVNAAIEQGAPYSEYPLVYLYKAYIQLPDSAKAREALNTASTLPVTANFPLRTEEIAMFETLLDLEPDNAQLHYLFGNLLYYLGQKDRGLGHWETAANLDSKNSFANRNAGFAYGIKGETDKAITFYDKAIKANPGDPLLLTESDKLREKAGVATDKRLKVLEKNRATTMSHDDAVIRLLTLYNETGNYDKAAAIMKDRHFHLWEGGGEIHSIYVDTHFLNGFAALDKKNPAKALEEFEAGRQYPTNLEVAPSTNWSYDAKALYGKGLAYKALNKQAEARQAFEDAAKAKVRGNTDLKYYQILAMRELGQTSEADSELKKMAESRDAMQKRVVDNYAKFGDADKNRAQSQLLYFSGLVEDLQGNHDKATAQWQEAVALHPGNLWARRMLTAK
ncbi:MAG: DUF5107 domain-containing protein [Firmicutes bacterium]|nr:DUF5107 domain-containing protein [Bacillota bacterium]MCM1401829.1 DUF5107 domain-containing protein [Bacteroides sp.]